MPNVLATTVRCTSVHWTMIRMTGHTCGERAPTGTDRMASYRMAS
jgi:hypothetical protein